MIVFVFTNVFCRYARGEAEISSKISFRRKDRKTFAKDKKIQEDKFISYRRNGELAKNKALHEEKNSTIDFMT